MMYADNCCTYTESYEGGQQTYVFTGPCYVTKKPYSVTVKAEELFAYRQSGSLSSFASLSAGDREFLKSGMTPEGWEQTFGKEDE